MTTFPMTLEGLKRQAKSLRADMAAEGVEIGHSRALEMVGPYGLGGGRIALDDRVFGTATTAPSGRASSSISSTAA